MIVDEDYYEVVATLGSLNERLMTRAREDRNGNRSTCIGVAHAKPRQKPEGRGFSLLCESLLFSGCSSPRALEPDPDSLLAAAIV